MTCRLVQTPDFEIPAVSIKIGDSSGEDGWIAIEEAEWMKPGYRFDGVGLLTNFRFIEAKWFARPPINKARKGVSRKAARKMRRKWYV